MALCPGCGLRNEAREDCASCGVALEIAGLHLERLIPSATAEVDGAGDLYLARGEDGERLVRVARLDERARLERERTVLSGLKVAGVPRVLDTVPVEGVGEALIMSPLPGPTLAAALRDGLRTDGRGARRFLLGALRTLAALEALSPPVHHRNLSPQTLTWDGEDRVELFDFSRATDVAADVSGDLVTTALDYAPRRAAHASARDLYGVGATVVHLLSRRAPSELPQTDGRPRFREAVRVDEDLARFIDRLLDAERPGFASAAEALAELSALDDPRPVRGASPVLLALAGALVVLVAGAGVAFFSLTPTPPPAPPSPPPVRPSLPPPPPPPAPPGVPEPRVQLNVSSTPPGATVFVDGRALGRTPLEIERAPGAELALRVELDGYRPAERALTLEQSLTWELTLEKEPRVRKPQAPKFTEDPNAAILRAIERAVRAQRAEVERCDPHGIDRVKFHLVLGAGGQLSSLRPLGSGATAAARCVEAVLRDQVRYPTPPGDREVSADVWVWLAPGFKVAAF